ncbi:hypothetical protein [Bdellovibrio sp. ZAP7]|uniref:hypothetical protein n=1 Tax=Bdellovibrio sp. ZAP7 TaxID=2231053 RepID=UPI0011574D0D|nr:hypothetical protein [Bdellovibrio sp. ZAP7]
MKKLILASALLMITAGCTQGTKSRNSSQAQGAQEQTQTGPTQDMSAADAAKQAQASVDDGLIDSTSRQDALKNLTLKLYESTFRLQMDVMSEKLQDDNSKLLREFITKKFSPKGESLLQALSSGDIKSTITLKDLQIAASDKDMQFQALLMGFKKIAADGGFTKEQQTGIEKALIERQSLITPSAQEQNRIIAVSEHISKKAKTLIQVMHDGAQDETVCQGYGYFLANFNALLTDSKTFRLPQTIADLSEPLQPLLPTLDACPADIPGTRKLLGKELLGLIARMDKMQAQIATFLNPSIKDTDPLFLDIADRWALVETKEILENYKLPTTGDVDADAVVCNVDGTDYDAVVTSQTNTETAAQIKYERDGEKPFTIRKVTGQRGVTIAYISSKHSIASSENSNSVNAGDGFVGAVFSIVPGDSEAMKLKIRKDEGKDETITVTCHAK